MDHLQAKRENAALLVHLENGLGEDFKVLDGLASQKTTYRFLRNFDFEKKIAYRAVSPLSGVILGLSAKRKTFVPDKNYHVNGVYHMHTHETLRDAVTKKRKILFSISDKFEKEAKIFHQATTVVDKTKDVREFVKKHQRDYVVIGVSSVEELSSRVAQIKSFLQDLKIPAEAINTQTRDQFRLIKNGLVCHFDESILSSKTEESENQNSFSTLRDRKPQMPREQLKLF